jgi:hypothetical protein
MVEWLRPYKLAEYLSGYHFKDMDEAEREIYRAVLAGNVRGQHKGQPLTAEQLKKISAMRDLPPDIELNVDDAARLWGDARPGSSHARH